MWRFISMLVLLLLSINGAIVPSYAGNTFYVSSGVAYKDATNVAAVGVNDRANNISGSGKSRGTIQYPFKTIQYAAKQVQAGDTVIVRDGLYSENVYLGQNAGNSTVITSQSGTSIAPITFQAEHLAKAYVLGSARYDGVFHIKNGDQHTEVGWANIPNPISYVNINGFDLQSTGYDGKGVNLIWTHHINVTNCKVHDCGAGGLVSSRTDYIFLEGNNVTNCCRTSSYNCSGISTLQIRALDQLTNGYHNIIRRNTCYNNYIDANALNDLPDSQGVYHLITHTDGNGIIIDTSYQNVSMLIANNLVYRSGGRGIIDDGSPNVDIIGNTCYQNSTDSKLNANQDILIQQTTWATGGSSNIENAICKNMNVQDNIIWPLDGKHCVAIQNTTENISVLNNWFYSGNNAALFEYTTRGASGYPTPPFRKNWNLSANYGKTEAGVSKTGGNPLFVNPGVSEGANFRLQASSLCKDKSTSLPNLDLDNYVRPYGSGYDLGAFEYHPAAVNVILGGYRYQRSNGHYFQSVTLAAANGDVTGPISLVLDNLTGSSLVNPTGTTGATNPTSSPYLSTSGLLSGVSTTLVLEFAGYPTGYTPRILVGNEVR